MTRPLRVLVVDDSLFMRAAIKRLLDERSEFYVVDMAKDGKEAVQKTADLRPDVITMDFNMPGMNGAEAVAEIMRTCPTPILMFSAHTRQGAAETFEALSAGAVDFVTKPQGEVSTQIDAIADELCSKLLIAANARPQLVRAETNTPKPTLRVSRTMPAMSAMSAAAPKFVFIAISTGGPVALSQLIPALPAALRVGIVIVQHMPATFTKALADRLDQMSAVAVREARDGQTAEPGLVLLAPGGHHITIDANCSLRLTQGPLVHGCRPAADVLMKSAAQSLGRRAIALVMTGMGKDGAEGLRAIKEAGGATFAQDQNSCVIYGMPKAALDTGSVDEVVSLRDLPRRLQQL